MSSLCLEHQAVLQQGVEAHYAFTTSLSLHCWCDGRFLVIVIPS
jgi:hypothetical protein